MQDLLDNNFLIIVPVINIGAILWLVRSKSSNDRVIFNHLRQIVRKEKLDINKVAYHSSKVSVERVVINDILSSSFISKFPY